MNFIYRANDLPVLQNRVYSNRDDAVSCATGDVALVQDPKSGLIYNRLFCQDKLVYDSDYDNEQSHSHSFQAHLSQVKAIVEGHLGVTDLLEIGCGKGYFLELLRRHGFDIIGCDPTYEGSSPNVIKQFYNADLALKNKNILMRHVLEHIPDPLRFLELAARINEGGLVYIEVPCIDWIARNNTWFDIFYEHVNYFRLIDLLGLFSSVVDAGYLFGGQYIYIVAELKSLKRPSRSQNDFFTLPIGFGPKFDALQNKPSIAIWGAASKGVLFALQAQMANLPLQCAIDINPKKQNRFLASSGLSVLSPQVALATLPPGAHIVVMNSNYGSEIVQMVNDTFSVSFVDSVS